MKNPCIIVGGVLKDTTTYSRAREVPVPSHHRKYRDVQVPRHHTLTQREMLVVILIASGYDIMEIVDHVHLSLKTVSTFKTRALAKLGLRNTSDLVYYALAHGLIK